MIKLTNEKQERKTNQRLGNDKEVRILKFRTWKLLLSHPSPVATIATTDKKGVSFLSQEPLIPMDLTNVFLLFNPS